jgi:hypothetical protein
LVDLFLGDLAVAFLHLLATVPRLASGIAGVGSAVRRRRSAAPPDPHVSTSYLERRNLTMRMSIRRFTRLTNAFSKKPETQVVGVTFLHHVPIKTCAGADVPLS